MKNRDMNNCNRCGGDVGFGVLRERITLASLYEAILCVDCHSDWNLFSVGSEIFKDIKANEHRIYTIFQQVAFNGESQEGELARLQEEAVRLHKEWFSIAETWVNDRIEREKPEPVPPPTDEEIIENDKRMVARYEKRLKIMRERISSMETQGGQTEKG